MKRKSADIPILAGGASVVLAGLVLLSCVAVQNPPPSQEAPRAEKQFMNLEYFPKPNGYTHVVTSPPGKMIFLSGQGGASQDGEMPKDFASQAENTFKNIEQCLRLAGAGFDDIVKINYYLTDIGKLEELRAVRAKYINMSKPPASTLVETRLIGDLLLEIEAIAIVPQ